MAARRFPSTGELRLLRNARLLCEFGVRHTAHHHDQGHLEALDRRQLVWNVANAAVVRNGHAPVRAAVRQPLLVAASGREQVAMALDLEAGLGQDARELLSQVAIGEPDAVHAAWQ